MSGFYDDAIEGFLNGDSDYDVDSGDLSMQAVDSSYVFDSTHSDTGDITGSLGSAVLLTTVGITGGVITADNPTFPDIPLSNTVTGVIVYLDVSGKLVCFINQTPSGTPLSFVGDGASHVAPLPGGRIASI